MNKEERISTKEKLHPNNKHRNAYDFKKLSKVNPKLKDFIRRNEHGILSVNFSDNKAVVELNKSILNLDYGINHWSIPKNYLCPPIPGRADYIHHIAELMESEIDKKESLKCLDIGVGANCIYPIIGTIEYNWTFVGSDIDQSSLDNAQQIIDNNESLKSNIELRFQNSSQNFFSGIIKDGEIFDLSICNPPFYTSQKDYENANITKNKNLSGEKNAVINSNFGGQDGELWCLGGEKRFIKSMIKESAQFDKSVRWFSCLISKKENLKQITKTLEKHKATKIKILEMTIGHKISRVIAWSFL